MRNIVGPLLFSITFVLGVTFAYILLPLPRASAVPVFVEPQLSVNACELMEDNDSFDGKTVSLLATVYALKSGELVVHPLEREACNYSKRRYLSLPAELEVISGGEAEYLRDYLQKKKLEIDLYIEGSARIFLVDGKYKIYMISPIQITRMSSFRRFTPKAGAGGGYAGGE